jgi:hypothetical protein
MRGWGVLGLLLGRLLIDDCYDFAAAYYYGWSHCFGDIGVLEFFLLTLLGFGWKEFSWTRHTHC